MPKQVASSNLEMLLQETKQATREQKAKQRLANRAKRNQNKFQYTNKCSKYNKHNTVKKIIASDDKQNVSLPEITTKISGTENISRITKGNIINENIINEDITNGNITNENITNGNITNENTTNKNITKNNLANITERICDRYIGRHASPGASSITSHGSSKMFGNNGIRTLTSSSDSVLSSSSIDLISSNESLNQAKNNRENKETNTFNKNKAMRNSMDLKNVNFYNVKQATKEHQKYKVIKTNSYTKNNSCTKINKNNICTQTELHNKNRNTSDNGFSSSSGSDYSYGVSAAVVMPRQLEATALKSSSQKPKNYFVKINGQSLDSFHCSSSYTSDTSLTSRGTSSSINNKSMPESLSDRKKTTIIVHKIPEGVQTSREYNYGICVLKVCS